MADLNALTIFARVYESGSFSEAARRLKMPVSTVSRRVADLEAQLGIRLLQRSTRNLRLTDIGAEVLEQARRGLEIGDAVESIVANQQSEVSGTLRLSTPSHLSGSLLTPIIGSFLAAYPNVRVQVVVADRLVDQIAERVDLSFHVGALKDSSLVARKVLSYRHRLVASPAYLEQRRPPSAPADLLGHRLIAFSDWRHEQHWQFSHVNGRNREMITFAPHLGMNDFAAITSALLADLGMGDLPPVVEPHLVRTGQLLEVMPDWRFPVLDLVLVHLGQRHISRPVRLFKDLAAEMAPTLFPDLPT